MLLAHGGRNLPVRAATVALVALAMTASCSRGPSTAEDVARELERRAAAGDPVKAEELEWSEARPGWHWSELPDEREEDRAIRLRDLRGLQSDSAWVLQELGRRLDDERKLPAWTREIDVAAFWSLEEHELTTVWARLAWLRRDPSRWAVATPMDHVARWVRGAALQLYFSDYCELGRPDGLSAFFRDAPDIGTYCVSDYDNPQPWRSWEYAQAERCLARMEALAMLGESDEVLETARSMVCLQRAFSDLTNRWRGVHRARIDRDFVRQVEACLPLLSQVARRELLTILNDARDTDWSQAFERVLQAHRASYYEYYERRLENYARRQEQGDRDHYEGGPFLHDQFLSYLAVYDEVFAAVRLSSFADRVERLRSIEGLSRDETFRFWALNDLEGLADEYVTALEVEALRRCAAIGAAYVIGGSESLEDVVATLPDPFTSESLHTRLRDDGVFEVWSVGADLVDDGGETADAPGDVDADIVFRVPAATR